MVSNSACLDAFLETFLDAEDIMRRKKKQEAQTRNKEQKQGKNNNSNKHKKREGRYENNGTQEN